MSYILDALKKSDKERQQGEVPGLNSIHDRFPFPGHRSGSRQKKIIFMAVTAVLLLLIPFATWYWKTTIHQPDETVIINEPTPTVDPVNPVNPVTPVTPPLPSAEIKTTELKIPTPEPIKPSQKKEAPLLQAELPELHFAGHTYSDDPAKRMIIINDSILREGGKVNEDITLSEITWTGIILDYNGQQIELVIK